MYPRSIILITCYIATIAFIHNIKLTECSKDEQLLRRKLLRRYQPDVRPVTNANLSLPVDMQLRLKSIVNLDGREQILQTSLWPDYYWKDANLVWNPVSTLYT